MARLVWIFNVNEKYSENINQLDTDNAVIFIDVDGVKHINDYYGHDVGDQVLKTLAKRIKDTLIKTEVCVRYREEIKASVSLGVCTGKDDFKELINHADQAMY